ncbi:hypothetical protein Hamer_G005525 [Homarus americanus]|uniref:Uncharacterized protein n=1 Tax=Homarus americanus TaxID=6706 RepID=A0A8J5JZD1_HOMAM|nr:hypothetical protein Hamer_G005525 [Homarus americanus]
MRGLARLGKRRSKDLIAASRSRIYFPFPGPRERFMHLRGTHKRKHMFVRAYSCGHSMPQIALIWDIALVKW